MLLSFFSNLAMFPCGLKMAEADSGGTCRHEDQLHVHAVNTPAWGVGSEESHVRGLMLCRLRLEILHDFTLNLRFVSEVQ